MIGEDSDGIPDDVAGLTRALVRTPSVNPSLEEGGAGEAAAAELAAGWLSGWGFDVDLVEAAPGRPSVLARLRPDVGDPGASRGADRGAGPGAAEVDPTGAGRSLILNGHLDTVGVAGMTIDPFGGEVRDGRLWGRGSSDMKSGVAAALAAARDAATGALGELRGELIVALTADEEEAGLGCRRLIEDGLRADAAVVCEPTGLAIMPAHKGFTWLRVEFHGQAAHGSRPERGVDAIRHAGLFLARLDEVEATLNARGGHRLLGRGSIHAGTIEGGSAPSVYPSSCQLVLERRTLPGETESAVRSEVEYLLGQLRSDMPALDARLDVTLHRGGSEVDADHELVVSLRESLHEVGLEPRLEGMTAWVEAVVFNDAGIPAICFGPGTIDEAHTADESVALSELEPARRALAGLIRRYLS